MDSIDEFKLKALDTMSETIGVLENEVEKSKAYVARVQSQDQRAGQRPARHRHHGSLGRGSEDVAWGSGTG